MIVKVIKPKKSNDFKTFDKRKLLSFQKRQKLLHKSYFLMFNQHDKIKIKYKIVLIFFINSI